MLFSDRTASLCFITSAEGGSDKTTKVSDFNDKEIDE